MGYMSITGIKLDGKSTSDLMVLGIATGACIGIAGGLLKAFNEQMINDYVIGFFKALEHVLGEASKGAILGAVVAGSMLACAASVVSSLPVIGHGTLSFK